VRTLDGMRRQPDMLGGLGVDGHGAALKHELYR